MRTALLGALVFFALSLPAFAACYDFNSRGEYRCSAGACKFGPMAVLEDTDYSTQWIVPISAVNEPGHIWFEGAGRVRVQIKEWTLGPNNTTPTLTPSDTGGTIDKFCRTITFDDGSVYTRD